MNPIDGLVLTRHYAGPDDWLEVVSASPVARFSAEVLRHIRHGERGHDLTIDRVALGAVLRIRGRNRTVVYQLAEYDEKQDTFTGVWPD